MQYASCEEQATILRTMSNHLTSAIEDANAMISSMVLTCEAGGREKAMASNLQAKQLASETREPRQALCAKTSQVSHGVCCMFSLTNSTQDSDNKRLILV